MTEPGLTRVSGSASSEGHVPLAPGSLFSQGAQNIDLAPTSLQKNGLCYEALKATKLAPLR